MRVFLDMYEDLIRDGVKSSPRGQEILEIEDYMLTLDPTNSNTFTSFAARNLNIDYIKAEMLWYLRANPYDDMITEAAQMWTDIRQPDGQFFSNYGQYWFGEQGGFYWVVAELIRDKDSRRAVIPMLNASHLFPGNKDVVCTESISFRIRDNKLNMSVNMRSQDAIWGLTNDVPCFHMLWELVFERLRRIYPDLLMGRYRHKLDSLHVYKRHYKMLHSIVKEGVQGWYPVHMPSISSVEEVDYLIRYQEKDYGPDDRFHFANWLFSNRYQAK